MDGSCYVMSASGAVPLVQSPNSHSLDVAGFGAAVAFLVLDVGWVLSKPSLFLCGTIPGLALQVFCVQGCIRHRRMGFEVLMEVSMLLWLLSNACWAGTELVWPPSGFLAGIPAFSRLDLTYRSPLMVGSTCVLAVPCMMMAAPYIRLRKGRWARSVASSAESTPGCIHESGLRSYSSGCAGVVENTELAQRYVYLLPFLVADWVWCFCNLLQLGQVSDEVLLALACLIFVFGLASLVLGTLVVRRDLRSEMRSNAAMLAADVLWVAGNTTWALSDVLSRFEEQLWSALFFYMVVVMFFLSGLGMAVSLFVKNRGGGPPLALAGSVLICETTVVVV